MTASAFSDFLKTVLRASWRARILFIVAGFALVGLVRPLGGLGILALSYMLDAFLLIAWLRHVRPQIAYRELISNEYSIAGKRRAFVRGARALLAVLSFLAIYSILLAANTRLAFVAQYLSAVGTDLALVVELGFIAAGILLFVGIKSVVEELELEPYRKRRRVRSFVKFVRAVGGWRKKHDQPLSPWAFSALVPAVFATFCTLSIWFSPELSGALPDVSAKRAATDAHQDSGASLPAPSTARPGDPPSAVPGSEDDPSGTTSTTAGAPASRCPFGSAILANTLLPVATRAVQEEYSRFATVLECVRTIHGQPVVRAVGELTEVEFATPTGEFTGVIVANDAADVATLPAGHPLLKILGSGTPITMVTDAVEINGAQLRLAYQPDGRCYAVLQPDGYTNASVIDPKVAPLVLGLFLGYNEIGRPGVDGWRFAYPRAIVRVNDGPPPSVDGVEPRLTREVESATECPTMETIMHADLDGPPRAS